MAQEREGWYRAVTLYLKCEWYGKGKYSECVQIEPSGIARKGSNAAGEFKSRVTAVEEIADGYQFELPGIEECRVLLENLMTAERACCPFLEPALHTEPSGKALKLTISGPAGAKDFVRALFV